MGGVTLPPCHRSRAHTKPIPGRPDFDQALAVCKACPLIKDCARQALTAGDSLDGHVKRPAMDVIQAGVHCTGDQMTAWRLCRVAGIPAEEMPTIRDTTPRNEPPVYCRSCGSPMTSWTRGEVPAGMVMHYGRGFCTNCRGAYREELAEAREEEAPNLYGGRTREAGTTKFTTPDDSGEDSQLGLF